MSDKKRLLDVWIVEINTVYREVPYSVVIDWLMQGRVLPEDRVRRAGGKSWHPIDTVPAFAPYLPQPAPVAVEDQAEALEPVDLGFDIPARTEDEDEDVDMIPLIDISLVLLIFFMMTATISSGVFANIKTPSARHQLSVISEGSLWVGIEPKSRSGAIETDARGKPLPVSLRRGGPMRLLAHLLGQAFDKPDMNMMSLSATNRLPGVVVKVNRGEVMSKVVIEVAPDVHIGSVITTDSVKRLGLQPGRRAMAVIKATEVLVAAQLECESEYEDANED